MATTFSVVPDEIKYGIRHRTVNIRVNWSTKRVILHAVESRFFEPPRGMEMGLKNQEVQKIEGKFILLKLFF